MRGVSVLFILGLYTACGSAQFLNNRPFPTYSLENMPDTEFSCRDKILGGYYADVDAQCQMFHICVKVAGVGVQDFRFLCPNGTAFDQDHQICAEWEDVDCDASTLYYSSDNFDLYRLGSGFESKAKKYGEDEETFGLQRAETGDVRLNREHQTQRVNQQKETTYNNNRKAHQQQSHRPNNDHQQQSHRQNNDQDHERDIFKGSSSSNFFNNRNGGKETEDDYDDNVNANQNNDQFQKRKLNRKPMRRPVNNNQQQDTTSAPVPTPKRIKQTQPRLEENQTNRPQKPTGFINNFAGSSYVPTTTPRGTTTLTNERYTVAVNNHRNRNSVRHRAQIPDRQYNSADNFRQSQSTSEPLTVSTPAPFRQSNQYNNPPSRQSNQYNNNYNNQQNYPTTPAFNKQTTQNYPRANNNQQNDEYNDEDFDIKKSTKVTENYPQKTNFEVKKSPAPFQNQNDNYPTTFSPKKQYYQTTTKKVEGYNTISQVTTQYNTNNQNTQNQKQQQSNYQNNQQQQFNTQKPQPFSSQKPNNQNTQQPQPFSNQKSNNYNQFNSQKTNYNQQSTPKTTPYTQYTPTIPKITSTTPISRSNRFDETQYDDGSYNGKYDYDDRRDDEFLKTAHSQNIAKSRNDLAQSHRAQEQSKQAKSKGQYESPRPFSVTPNAPAKQDNTRPSQPITPRYTQQQPVNKQRNQQPVSSTTQVPKKTKDVSYDYAYYDSNGSEAEYDIDTEIKKSSAKN
ncbi:GATA zinc finger domain-containing protein 14-like isoform X2 [Harmonia axyridis]|uniref:GATA zinc finger domain-containing protein 14-like isoform X2 n=1 Tax=Harmonia axyridis TaxID=115357 RepID=UPI001E275A7B|nr:GATA zinc finger domain-containing protein 14-like isoform X2 [Harmonia axyridis]